MPTTGMVSLRVLAQGGWHFFENFDPTDREFRNRPDPVGAAVQSARDTARRLLSDGIATAGAVTVPLSTERARSGVIFLGVINAKTDARLGGCRRSAPVFEHQR